MSQDIDKAYVSPYDRLLAEFDATHELSASQLREIKKHELIFERRDKPIVINKDNDDIWTNF